MSGIKGRDPHSDFDNAGNTGNPQTGIHPLGGFVEVAVVDHENGTGQSRHTR